MRRLDESQRRGALPIGRRLPWRRYGSGQIELRHVAASRGMRQSELSAASMHDRRGLPRRDVRLHDGRVWCDDVRPRVFARHLLGDERVCRQQMRSEALRRFRSQSVPDRLRLFAEPTRRRADGLRPAPLRSRSSLQGRFRLHHHRSRRRVRSALVRSGSRLRVRLLRERSLRADARLLLRDHRDALRVRLAGRGARVKGAD